MLKKIQKNLIFSVCLIAIFCLAIAVWYSPVIFKGYNSSTNGSIDLIKARNLALNGNYASESKLNVILSSELIPTQASESLVSNKLGAISYSYLFKFIKISNNQTVVLINCIILALALLIFALGIYYLFGFKISIFFSLVYIFLPSNWLLPQSLMGYEFALLFLSLFFLFFCLGTQKFTKDEPKINLFKIWPNYIYLVLAGIFLCLACFSRESFLLLLPILFIFLLVLKLRKYLYYIFTPLIILLIIFWLPNFVTEQNTYSSHFVKSNEQTPLYDYAYYGHLFPDPYTYHFNKYEFLEKNISNLSQADVMTQLSGQKNLINRGQISINLWQRTKIGTSLLLRHIFRFFSITEIGGPFIFFLFFLGLYVLKKQTNYWFKFYLSWIIGTIFIMSYIALLSRNHIMDFGWAIAICVAFGTVLLADLLGNKLSAHKYKTLINILLLLLVIYNLVLCGHVMWGQIYDNSSVPLLTAYTNKINTLDINNDEIIAVPFRTSDAYNLNFNTDKSIIVFKTETIEQLLIQEQLDNAFNKFNVKYILGYEPELSEQIIEKTQTQIIADSSIEIKQEDLNINNKNWFMNLVK